MNTGLTNTGAALRALLASLRRNGAWSWSRRGEPIQPRWILLCALLVLFKLWLTRAQSLLAIGDSPGDDRLYLELANHLARGAWLGPYNYLTLAKMPFYPMWIAASFGLGVPLLLAQQLLYAASCLVAVIAVRPILESPAWRSALFMGLLWNPWSFADQVMTRAAREGIYPSLAILVLATAVGLGLRHGSRASSLVPWVLSLGLSSAALWLTREEGIWILPMVVFGLCVRLGRRDTWRRLLGAATIAFCVWSGAIGLVLWKNSTRYGMAVLSEQTGGPFVEAFRSMVRVRSAHWRRSVPLPRETREMLYVASPAFARLRGEIEGPSQPNWIAIGCKVYGLCDEIGAGAIHWALRDAAARQGLLATGIDATRYWLQVANEINAACHNHALDCDPPGRGNAVLDRWRSEHWGPLWTSLREGTVDLLRLHGVQSRPTPSVGPLSLLDIFRDLTRERLAGLDAQVQRVRASAVVRARAGEDLRVELRTARGDADGAHVERLPATASDAQGVHSAPMRFRIEGYCPGGCFLLLLTGGKEVGRIPLQPGRVALVDAEVTIDGVVPDPWLPRQERLDARRFRVIDGVIAAYGQLLPVVVPLALLSWLAAAALGIRYQEVRTLWLVASAALLGCLTRMLLLGAVSAVAFPSMSVLYASAAPPLLFIFCGLAFAASARTAKFLRQPTHQGTPDHGRPGAKENERNG